MSPRTQQQNEALRAERFQQILDVALAVFAEKGYFDTKIEDIAKRLGIAKGTIYLYVDSKEALFETVFRKKFEVITAPLYALAADLALTPADKLLIIAQMTLEMMSQETDLTYVMIQAISTPQVAKLLAHDFKAYYDEFASVLAPLFEALGEPDSMAGASLYIAVLDGAMVQGLVGAAMFDQERMLAQIRERFRLQPG